MGHYARVVVTYPSCMKRQISLVPLLTVFGTDSQSYVCVHPLGLRHRQPRIGAEHYPVQQLWLHKILNLLCTTEMPELVLQPAVIICYLC